MPSTMAEEPAGSVKKVRHSATMQRKGISVMTQSIRFFNVLFIFI